MSYSAKARSGAAVLVSVIAMAGLANCNSNTGKSSSSVQLLQRDAAHVRLRDTAIALLRQGDLVLRLGASAESYMLSQFNQRDKSYSHCGIVMMEHGYPFVYHSIGGEDNPDERLRRDSAVVFFSPAHNLRVGIYRYSTYNADSLRQIVTGWYRARPLFDMQFDMATDDRLYCAEFVCKAVRQAAGDTEFFNITHNMGHTYVGIDDLFLSPHAALVWQTEYK